MISKERYIPQSGVDLLLSLFLVFHIGSWIKARWHSTSWRWRAKLLLTNASFIRERTPPASIFIISPVTRRRPLPLSNTSHSTSATSSSIAAAGDCARGAVRDRGAANTSL